MYETLVHAGKISVPRIEGSDFFEIWSSILWPQYEHKCSNKIESDFSRQIQELFPT